MTHVTFLNWTKLSIPSFILLQLRSHMKGVIKVKSVRQYCSFYVTFSDPMKALEAFGDSDDLLLNEGRVLVLFARQREFSF